MDDEQRPRLYGRRKGHRLRKGKQTLVETLLPELRVALPEQGGRIDPAALFDRPVEDLWLEIGFGGGEHLAAQASQHPTVGLIGCEPFLNGIASLLDHVAQGGLRNVRILPDDARPLIAALPDASVGRVFLLFPDPWPKKRHERRRFVGPENLDALARVMRDGAEFRVASDDMGYIRWSLAHLTDHPAFEWTARGADDWRERTPDWPPTRYEMKAIRQGRRPVFLRFRRRPRHATP